MRQKDIYSKCDMMAFENIIGILQYISEFSVTSLVLIITVGILLKYVFLTDGYPPLPPSPYFKLPVIGHLYLLDHDMRKPLRKYHKQLGDVYSMYFGGRLGIVIAGYETIKEAFVNHGDLFADRPRLYISDIATRKRGIVLANGQLWKEHRRFTLKTLKDFGMGKSKLEGNIHEEIKTFISEIDNFKGEAFDPKDIISTHVSNIICSILFKGHFKHDDPRFLGTIKIFDENMEAAAGLANLIPWLAEFPGDPLNCKKVISSTDKVFEYLENIIDEHVREFDENDIDDLTSAYIGEIKKLKSANQETTMNLQQLAGLICDLFVAGSHTTTASIGWAVVCLVEYPEIQEKLYKDITTNIGDQRLPSVADKTSLAYLEAFYLEVLRYCNITVMTGLHATTRDLTFKGFTIPKDALIMPDMDSVFTDPHVWEDPENFRPERFLTEDGNIRKRDEMIAFFFGKRSCIGESLARMELFLFLGALVQKFRLESPQNERLSVREVDGIFGLVHCPKRYKVVARPRK